MLIVIRGNSGSGKTTTAKLLREKAIEKNERKKIAVIEQDYLRRTVLKEKELEGDDNIDLIKQTVLFALSHGYRVILEGILRSDRYGKMLKELIEASDEAYVYYFELPFEETLHRHSFKANSHEFGKKEMKQWFVSKDVLGVADEAIITKELTQDQVIQKILSETGI